MKTAQTQQTQAAQTTGTTAALAPQPQATIAQIPSAFIRLRQQQQIIISVRECPRCQKPVVPQNAVFCAGCGLPLFGAPCPSCQNMVEYYPDHMQPRSEIFWCPFCGAELEWHQISGGPAYLKLH